ncbi:CR-type domain-containing protein [Plasmodiophora brassicae]
MSDAHVDLDVVRRRRQGPSDPVRRDPEEPIRIYTNYREERERREQPDDAVQWTRVIRVVIAVAVSVFAFRFLWQALSFALGDHDHHHQHHHGKTQTQNVVVNVPLSTAFRSERIRFRLDERIALCPVCGGRGASPGGVHTCGYCMGLGEREQKAQLFPGGPIFKVRQRCSACDGQGEIVTDPCLECNGRGMVLSPEELSLRVPRGIMSGEHVVLAGQGSQLPGHTKGDVIVTVDIESTEGPFSLVDNDIHFRMDITLREALLGFSRSIDHLDGSTIAIDRTGMVTPPEETIVRPGLGWPARGDRPAGDLIIHFEIEFPDRIDPVHHESLRNLLQ